MPAPKWPSYWTKRRRTTSTRLRTEDSMRPTTMGIMCKYILVAHHSHPAIESNQFRLSAAKRTTTTMISLTRTSASTRTMSPSPIRMPMRISVANANHSKPRPIVNQQSVPSVPNRRPAKHRPAKRHPANRPLLLLVLRRPTLLDPRSAPSLGPLTQSWTRPLGFPYANRRPPRPQR